MIDTLNWWAAFLFGCGTGLAVGLIAAFVLLRKLGAMVHPFR